MRVMAAPPDTIIHYMLTNPQAVGAEVLALVAAFLVVLQIRLAKNQLFASLSPDRRKWQIDYIASVDARAREITELKISEARGTKMPKVEALIKVQDLAVQAQWLFDKDVWDQTQIIEQNLAMLMQHWTGLQRAGLEHYAGGEQATIERYQQAKEELNNSRRRLIELLGPFLYVGNVRRGFRSIHRIKVRWWRLLDARKINRQMPRVSAIAQPED